MGKNFRFGHLALAVMAFCLCSAVCSGQGAHKIVSSELLSHVGLTRQWEGSVSLKNGENIDRIFLLGDKVYVLTDANYLFCLTGDKGKFLFGRTMTTKTLPVFDPKVYGNEFVIVAGNTLIVLDVNFGSLLAKSSIEFPVATSAAVNSKYLYMAGLDKRLRAFDKRGIRKQFTGMADNGSGITSVLATETVVAFATDAGNVVAFAPDAPKKYWQRDVVGSITAPLVGRGNWIYASSRDTNVYKLSLTSGEIAWKVQSGAVLSDSPRVTDTMVYQRTPNRGIFAVDAKSGKVLWQLDEAVDLLAEAGTKAYVITRDNTCAVMDNLTGSKLYSINFKNVNKYVANTNDASIYVADKNGRVARFDIEQ